MQLMQLVRRRDSDRIDAVSPSREPGDVFVMLGLYLLLCVTLVLYIYRIPVAGVNLSAFRVLVLLWIVIMAASVAVRLARGRVRFDRQLLVPLTIAAGILVINAIDFAGLPGHPALRRDIANHVFNIVLAGVVALHVNSEQRLRSLLKAFALSSLVTSAITLYAMTTGAVPFEATLRTAGGGQGLVFLNDNLIIRRATSAFFDPNFYAMYSVLVIGSLLYLRRVGDAGRWLLALIPINLVFLGLTLSRTGLIAALAALAVAWLLQPRLRTTSAVTAFLLLPCFWGATVFQTHQTREAVSQEGAKLWESARKALTATSEASPETGGARPQTTPPKAVDSAEIAGRVAGRMVEARSLAERIRYVENGWRVFTKNPVFGAGSAALLAPDIPFSSAHVAYLTLAARYGLLGLAVYLAFMVWPVAVVWRAGGWRHPHLALLLSTVGALWIVYLSYDLFLFFEVQYLFYGMAYAIAVRDPTWRAEAGGRVLLTRPSTPSPATAA